MKQKLLLVCNAGFYSSTMFFPEKDLRAFTSFIGFCLMVLVGSNEESLVLKTLNEFLGSVMISGGEIIPGKPGELFS